jgi:hypothetical protein
VSSIARSRCLGPQYGTAVPGKKASSDAFGAGLGNFCPKSGLDWWAFHKSSMSQPVNRLFA